MSPVYARINGLVQGMERAKEIPANKFFEYVDFIVNSSMELVDNLEISEIMSRTLNVAVRLNMSGQLSDKELSDIDAKIKAARNRLELESSDFSTEINLLVRFGAEMTTRQFDSQSFTFTRRPEDILRTIKFTKDFLGTMRGVLYRDVLLEQTGNAYYGKMLDPSAENLRMFEAYMSIGKELGFYTEETKEQYLMNCRNACPEFFGSEVTSETQLFDKLNI